MNKHIEAAHNAGPPLPCPFCGKQFQYLNTHIKRIHEETKKVFTCEECGKTSKTKSDLNQHIRCHLPDDIKLAIKEKEMKKHQCIPCGKQFVGKFKLRYHEATKHTIRSYHCQQCPKSFFRSGHLKSHVTSYHGYK